MGERITWRFAGVEPHSVTVANGPRGFSSNYLGNTTGTYSFTPTVPGTYRLTCLIHPTTMGSDAARQTLLKKFSPRLSSAFWASMLSRASSPVNSSRPIVIRTTPESAVITR